MLIPAVSVICVDHAAPGAAGDARARINRLRVMPKRIVERQDPEDGLLGPLGAVRRSRRPIPVAIVGIAIVAVLLVARPAAQSGRGPAEGLPRAGGDAINGREALDAAGISPGVMKPFVVLIENSGPDAARRGGRRATSRRRGSSAAVAPPQWRRDGDELSSKRSRPTDSASSESSEDDLKLQHDVLPRAARRRATLGGVAAEDRDFVHAVYGKFPYVLAFVILLTFVLLMRAFRSILLPLKAVILNLVSLGAAYGIIVFIFQ